MTENPGIAACMRLNARLTKRVDSLQLALERIAGPTACSGAMVEDEDGKPFSPETADAVRRAHARSSVRCIAREVLNDCSDLSFDRVTATDSIERIVMELKLLRAAQDEQWGGPEHDDTHTWGDWTWFIIKFNDRATQAISHDDFEYQMKQVMGLAVAAIQSSRRKRMPQKVGGES